MPSLWSVVVARAPLRCQRCGEGIAVGGLVARHTSTGLPYHPACAGVAPVVVPMRRVRRPAALATWSPPPR
jgi:hypothetical protein